VRCFTRFCNRQNLGVMLFHDNSFERMLFS